MCFLVKIANTRLLKRKPVRERVSERESCIVRVITCDSFVHFDKIRKKSCSSIQASLLLPSIMDDTAIVYPEVVFTAAVPFVYAMPIRNIPCARAVPPAMCDQSTQTTNEKNECTGSAAGVASVAVANDKAKPNSRDHDAYNADTDDDDEESDDEEEEEEEEEDSDDSFINDSDESDESDESDASMEQDACAVEAVEESAENRNPRKKRRILDDSDSE